MLTPAEKARQLGVTTDTLRRWENEDRIQSSRTAGGQRRYREGDQPTPATRARAIGKEATREELELEGRHDEPRQVAPAIPHWQERIEERRADVEIAKLDREHRALLSAEATEREERRRRREQEEQRAEAERERQAFTLRESQRIGALVQHGVLLSLCAPFEYQALVKRELLAYVTPERFPAQLSAMEVHALLAKRVEQILKPLRDKERVDELLRVARSHVGIRTLGSDWDYQPSKDARREVEARLAREVDATWNTGDVRARVDEILDEWD